MDFPAVNVDGNSFQLLPSGAQGIAALEALIDQAQQVLELEMYLFRSDVTGERIKAALLRAASRGVSMRLLLDDFGSGELPKAFFAPLVERGVHVRSFNPSRVLRVAFRDHRKLCVADNQVAIVGGFNIGDEYAGDGVAQGWRDLGLKIAGPLVAQLSKSFDRMFAAALMDASAFWIFVKRGRRAVETSQPALLTAGPGFGGASLRRILYKDVANARRIDVSAAYFAPTWSLRRRLLEASPRGLVRLVLPGKTDVAVLRFAGQYLYTRLLVKGIRIYEYQPQVMHAKLIVIDDIVYIGSSNLDTRSLRINFELLVRVKNSELAAQARELIEADIQHSKEITLREWQLTDTTWRHWLRRIAYWLVVRFDPFLVRRRLRGLR